MYRGNFRNSRSFSSNNNYKKGTRTRSSKTRIRGQSQIDVNKFINKAQEPTFSEQKITNSFTDFDLNPKLLENILKKGFEKPMPIQDQAIPNLLQGKDLIGIANTGMGKTAAFLIPMIQKIIDNPKEKVLIITPTRELAEQIVNDFRALSLGLNMYSVLVIGGVSIQNQIRNLKKGYNFVIGTPGRLKDLATRKNINYSIFTNVVVDEVDRMFDMGFSREVIQIFRALPRIRQSMFFSATMTNEVVRLINENSNNPVTITLKLRDTASTVDQDIIRISSAQNKIETLHNLLISKEVTKTLIFSRTKWGVKKLAHELIDRGFKVDSIHGNKTQFQRQKALIAFKNDMVNILVATDVAARGLDIPDISHVINYEAPEKYEDYIHRIGRTGRANKVGKALTFV